MVEENEITERVIGVAIEVQRHLGPGLLESAYVPILINGLKRIVNQHLDQPSDASPRNLGDLGVSAVNRKAH